MGEKNAYVFGTSTTPLLGQTIGQNLAQTVRAFPAVDALVSISQSRRLSYLELWDLTSLVAKGLLARGMKAADRIGLCAPNCYEWTVLQYATARIGLILVNINPAYRIDELKFVINQSEMRMLISPREFKNSNYQQMIKQVENFCPKLEQKFFLEDDWDSLLKMGETISDADLQAEEVKVQFDDAINIQYTSGTTGFPKGVTLSHHNILNNGFFIGQRLQYTAADRVCLPVPLFHCFGMVIGNLACTTHGATMVYPAASFDPVATLEAVVQERCTSLYGVPSMFISELQLPDFGNYDLSSLRTGVMAGSPCPMEIMKQVQSKMYMKEVTICYGMTETSPVSTQTRIGAPLDKQVSTVGTVQDHLEIKIIDPKTGFIVDRMVEGEICTRGYSVMLSYWNNVEATDSVIDQGGWMHTGDLGFIDAEDYLVVSGRIKDVIIRGGENISPRSIEEFLFRNPKVADVQVIGVPDAKYGEEIMAWVKVKDQEELNEEDLIRYCRDQIAHYKIPKYWKFVQSFPMTVSGKVRKVEMREMAIKELGLS